MSTLDSASTTSMRALYFSPLISAATTASEAFGHRCKAVPDVHWLKQGCLRVLSHQTSGRGHLQQLSDNNMMTVIRQTMQATLHSQRRLDFITAVNTAVRDQLLRDKSDPFVDIPSLRDYHIYAADGHSHEHATHDVPIEGKKRAVQHFYALNLRTQALSHLSIAESGGDDERKREHDIRALKRLTIDALRQHAPVGKKVLYVYDRASIDYQAWTKWKKNGVYFISHEKTNSALKVCGHLEYNKDDPINHGIISDDCVGSANSISVIRRITYRCPETGEIMTFLTNVFDQIPPGVIAYLYKRRWDIEKIFDTVKHSYHEKKAWASGDVAKSIQAHFICLQHNLACLFEQKCPYQDIEKPHHKRAAKRRKELEEKVAARKNGTQAITSLYHTVIRLSQHPLTYLRWLRVSLDHHLLVSEALARLARHRALHL